MPSRGQRARDRGDGDDRTSGGESLDRLDRLDRGAVIAEAVALIEEAGLADFTLTAVAARLSVSQPALYRHVANVEDLWSGIALHARQQLLAALSVAAVGKAGDEAIGAVADTWRRFAQTHTGLYKATDVSALAGDADNEAAAQELVALLAQVVAGYGLVDSDADQAAWALRSALHGFAVLEAERGNPASLDLDASFERLVTLLRTGLARWNDT